MKVQEVIDYYHDKYWILISFDFNLYNRDRRYIRYKISLPSLECDHDVWDVNMKDCTYLSNIRGKEIRYAIENYFKAFPVYERNLREVVMRKTEEYKRKQEKEV